MSMKDLRDRLRRFLNKNKKITSILPFLSLILISLIFFYQTIFQNKIPLPTDALVGAHVPWIKYSWEGYPAGVPIKNQEITDAISQFYPWRSLVGEFWRNGKFPLWNFYMFNGVPFLATLHSSALYPFNAFYLFLSDANAWSSLVFLQILLSLIFMYLFLRDNNLASIPSIFGAIAFSFSGYMIAWLEFATGGHAGLWLPLLLLVEKRYLESKKGLYFISIPIIFFFIFTAGDFQVPIYIIATYLLYSVYKYLHDNKRSLRGLISTTLALILGLLISSPQLIPTLELFKNSVRFDDPYIRQYFWGIMGWEKVVNFIWPDFFGNIVTRNYWGQYGFHEYMSYFGIVSLVFVIFSLIKKKVGEESFYWMIAILGLLFLFPTPLAFLPYKLGIPALSTSSASRVIFLVCFALSTISAFGFNKYYSKKENSISGVILILLFITAGIVIGLLISLKILNDNNTLVTQTLTNLKVSLKNMIPGTLILFFLLILDYLKKLSGYFSKGNKRKLGYKIFMALILFLALVDMLRYAWKNTPFEKREFLFPKVAIIDYLTHINGYFRIAGGIPTNLFMPYGLYSSEGYDPIYPERNAEWYSIVDWGNANSNTGRYGIIHYFTSPVINYANLKYVIDYKKDSLGQVDKKGMFARGITEPRYKEVYSDKDIYIFENTESLPYVWLTTDFQVINDRNEIINKLVSSKGPQLILESIPYLKIPQEKLDYSVTNLKKNFNQIEFDVETSNNAMLFLSESYFPGWKSFIDGNPTNIIKANYIFQSIEITKGKHKVVFIYDPTSFRIGLWFFYAALIVLMGIFLYDKKQRKNGV
jgi:hypothetical protein